MLILYVNALTGSGLAELSGGKVGFYLERQSELACKLNLFLFFVLESYSAWILTIISLERVFALYFPLKMHAIDQVKLAKWVIFINLIWSLISSIVVIFITDYYHNGNIYKCTPIFQTGGILSIIYRFVTLNSMMLYPILLATSFIILIVIQLVLDAKRRNETVLNSRQSTAQTGIARKEINASISIAVILVIDLIITIPPGISWNAYYQMTFYGLLTKEHGTVLYYFSVWIKQYLIIRHIWNFYVFMIRINSFKRELLITLPCRKWFTNSDNQH